MRYVRWKKEDEKGVASTPRLFLDPSVKIKVNSER